MSDEAKEKLAIYILSFLALILTLVLIFTIWKQLTSPKLELIKSEWECTKTEERLIPVSTGKVTTLLPKKICTEYHRK